MGMFMPIKTLSPEYKDITYYVANLDPGTATVNLINPITAGTGPNNMIGRKAVLKNLTVSYNVYCLRQTYAIFNQTPETVRVLVVYDNDPQGVAPVIADILDVAATPQGVVSLYYLKNTDRFKVIHDKAHTMGVYQTITGDITYNLAAGDINQNFKKTYPVNLAFEGPSTTGVIGVNRGAMWMICISNVSSSTANTIMNFTSRIRYTDA